jgi:hypothetical protein
VAVEVLRRALHREVDAQREGLLVHRAGERVVDDRCDPTRAAGFGDAPDVHAAQRRVDRRLEPDEPRALAEDTLQVREIVE